MAVANGIALGLTALLGVWIGWLAIPVVVAILALFKLCGGKVPLHLAAIVLAIGAFGAIRSNAEQSPTIPVELPASSGAIGSVRGFPKPIADDRYRVMIDLNELCLGEQCQPAEGCVIAVLGKERNTLSRGDVLQVSWRVTPLNALSTGYRGYVSGLGCAGSAWITQYTLMQNGPAPYQWFAQTRAFIGERMATGLEGDTAALAAGMVTGDDSALSDDTREDFRVTGATHLTSVSGQNVMLIVGFLSLWVRPRHNLRRLLFNAVLILVVWSYAALVGLEPPAMRAAIVATMIILGRHVGRKPDPVTLTALTLGAMALLNPAVVHGVGFWLSAVASFALCLTLPRTLPTGARKAVHAVAAAPVIASLATLPIVLVTFHSWSPISILANMLLAPIMVAAFPACYIYALIIVPFPWLAPVAAIVPGILVDFALAVVKNVAPLGRQIVTGNLSAASILMMCVPIIMLIALLSEESERWIARVLRTWHRT